MLQKTFKRALILGALMVSLASAANAQSSSEISVEDIHGTWSGTSVCVARRPGCKNEVVVYRFEPVSGKSDVVTLFADKIVSNKRIPMYTLEFQFDEDNRTLSPIRGRTRATGQYKVFNDRIEGTAKVSSVERRVKVRSVREDQVPAAPNRQAYGP